MTISGLEHHPHARAVLEPVLAPGGAPSHAYLFRGPAGTGKRAVARELAAQLLADGADAPELAAERARRGSHPDLTWVTPSGAAEMLVADIETPVVAAVARTPFEAKRRVFVIEGADRMGDATANRMLKTLEEPPPYAHLILVTDRPEDVLPTVASRCQHVRFDPLPADALAALLEQQGVATATARACALLSLGDGELARALAGGELRPAAEALARGALAAEPAPDWQRLLELSRGEGERAEAALAEVHAEELEFTARSERKRAEREQGERTRRAARRASQAALDRGLMVAGLWFRDVAAIADGAAEVVLAVDRAEPLAADAAGCGGARARAMLECVEETRRRLALNVNEELALEALAYRLSEIGPSRGSSP